MAKPTIFIPGFPGSELHDKNSGEKLFPPPLTNISGALQKLLQSPDDAIAGPPIADTIPGLSPAASTLYTTLTNYGVSEAAGNFVPVGWDWRQSIASDDTTARVRNAIDQLAPQGKVVAVVHSTGGLVIRAFLQRFPAYIDKLEQVLVFATPWRGTLAALHAVSQGEAIGLGPVKLVTAAQSKDLLSRAQAAYDLLPTDPGMGLYFADGAPSTPLADRRWIDADRPYMNTECDNAYRQSNDFPDLPVTNVCGWGGDTYPRCDDNGGQLTFSAPINEAGDGTVPFVSASALQGSSARSMFIPVGAYGDEGLIPFYHGQIWETKAARQIYDEVFNDAARQPLVAAAADKDQYIDPDAAHVRIRIAANGTDGSPLPNAKVSLRIGGNVQSYPINDKRMNLDLARGAFEQQVSNNIRRTELTVSWDGGQVKIPVLIEN